MGRKPKYTTIEQQREANRKRIYRWKANNPERFAKMKREWYEKNRDRLKEYYAKYCARMTPEELEERKRKQREYWHNRYYNDPEFRKREKEKVTRLRRERREREIREKEKEKIKKN